MKSTTPIIPYEVREVSMLETKLLTERGLKLTEEVGELAAEILKFKGLKGSKGKSKNQILKDLHLEAIDCMLMAMDILVHTGAKDENIRAVMNSQLKKWKKQAK